jgi:hypothetical protein
VLDILRIDGVKIAFAGTQVMDRVEEVGFAFAILSQETNDPFREVERCFCIAFELKNSQSFELNVLNHSGLASFCSKKDGR